MVCYQWDDMDRFRAGAGLCGETGVKITVSHQEVIECRDAGQADSCGRGVHTSEADSSFCEQTRFQRPRTVRFAYRVSGEAGFRSRI